MVTHHSSQRAKGKGRARPDSPPPTPTRATFPDIPPPPPRRRAKKKNAGPVALVLDIPYFAHMQLNPAKYPEEVGLPCGRPPYAEAPPGGVESSNETDLEDATSSVSIFTPQKRTSSTALEVSGSAYKKLKVDGGRPALPKKVTADLDSDDELIVQMKLAKYQEVEIAQRLKDEGRTNYHPKTIGTRWARLKRALAARHDELMDLDLTDWHDGDDDVLEKAVAHADGIVAKIKAEADERKWQLVADQIKTLKPVVNFSKNACKKRFEALNNGTAKPTPESIEDPDDYIKERVQARVDKEKAIADAGRFTFHSVNIQKNGWTSKTDKYERHF